jgi:hypothetical protein
MGLQRKNNYCIENNIFYKFVDSVEGFWAEQTLLIFFNEQAISFRVPLLISSNLEKKSLGLLHINGLNLLKLLTEIDQMINSNEINRKKGADIIYLQIDNALSNLNFFHSLTSTLSQLIPIKTTNYPYKKILIKTINMLATLCDVNIKDFKNIGIYLGGISLEVQKKLLGITKWSW